MLSNYELMEVHVSVLFKHNQAGRITSINEPGDPNAPRFFIGNTIQGTVERYHQSLGEHVINELKQIVGKAPWLDSPNQVNMTEIIQVLNKDRPLENIYVGPAYIFPDVRSSSKKAIRITHANIELLSPHFSDYVDDINFGQPVFAVVQNQVAVALCCSARQTSIAAEASLRTAKDFRGKAYALDVTTAWAAEVQEQGRMALYSTSWNNLSSQAVAGKLKLRQYGVDLHFS
ncbi:GNAT family N-acetyltransferase [Paenibacillus sp. TH7-28]